MNTDKTSFEDELKLAQKVSVTKAFAKNLSWATKEIVWQHKGSPHLSFFSPHISGAQRLGNGNTLICV